MVNWNGCEGKWAWTFEAYVYIFWREIENNHEIPQKAWWPICQFKTSRIASHNVILYLLKAYRIQSIFVKVKLCIFVITIDLKYIEIKKKAEATVFHPKRWESKDSGESNTMQAFILCTPNQILVNTCMFMP